eukprot:745146-Prorocentrum_lima.AAC.1
MRGGDVIMGMPPPDVLCGTQQAETRSSATAGSVGAHEPQAAPARTLSPSPPRMDSPVEELQDWADQAGK